MATLIKTDGTITEVKPANGNKFTLKEQQDYVHGYIEYHHSHKDASITVVMDEEGLLKGYQPNPKASEMIGYSVVGDVLLVKSNEIS